MMRKVKKQDEIPVKLLATDEDAIKKKAEIKRSVARKMQKRFMQLDKWLANQVNHDVITDDLVKHIYDVVDEYMREAVNPKLVCAKGCAHCCKVSVEVTAIEAGYIHNNTGFKATALPKGTAYKIDQGDVDYCNLLDQNTGLCKVYEHRPLACRIFGTFDHWKFCEDASVSHAVHSYPSQPYLGHLQENLLMWSGGTPYAAHADIRDWFTGEEK